MQNHKTITALIIMVSIVVFIGFSIMALAAVPSTLTSDSCISQQMTVDEGSLTKNAANTKEAVQSEVPSAAIEQAGIVAKTDATTSEAVNNKNEGTVKKEVKNAESTNTLVSTLAAESVPRYTMLRTDGTAAEANYIVTRNSDMNAGGMGGSALQWQNGGGPAEGTAQIVAKTANEPAALFLV
jgi:hypothetical protein